MKNQYKLIDSGDFKKLEIIDGFKIIRPSLNSPYSKTKPQLWERADAVYTKNDKGSGEWEFFKKIPDTLLLDMGTQISAKIKFTPFGHLGLFPEQRINWEKLLHIGNQIPGLELMNLFAYSGLSTLFALRSGMSVCHVDASKGMVEWARENAELSGLKDKPVRWIVEDVLKFIKREIKRGKKYNGFVLDPPSFGRGAKGEVWKIEDGLLPLLEMLMELCHGKPEFVFLSCHTSGYSPLVLERILQSLIKREGEYEKGELFIPEETGRNLSGGFFANFISRELHLKL